MSKAPLLNRLFDAHAKDLCDISPQYTDDFVCPICWQVLARDAIEAKLVNDGHVWQKDVRKVSTEARRMRVLLCRRCNSIAGTRGDKQAQLAERVRKGDESGELYGYRTVRISRETDPKPIRLNAKVTRRADNTVTLSWRASKDLKYLDSSPEDQARFEEIKMNNEKVNMAIEHYSELRPEFVPVGWITSAYLMAFYSLGYRLILHPGLFKPVREYILSSFEDGAIPEVPTREDFTLRWYADTYYPDPDIRLVFPLKDKKPVFIQVSCFQFQMRLPFRFSDSAFWDLFRREGHRITPELESFEAHIPCTKTVVHDCVFDYLLGKPAIIS